MAVRTQMGRLSRAGQEVEIKAKSGKSLSRFFPEVRDNPPAPEPEPITVDWLPLPPISPSDTGIDEGPAYLHDGEHVLLTVTFAGAADDERPTENHVVLVKTGGGAFASGDPWKCLTRGVPAENQAGRNAPLDTARTCRFRSRCRDCCLAPRVCLDSPLDQAKARASAPVRLRVAGRLGTTLPREASGRFGGRYGQRGRDWRGCRPTEPRA